MQINWNTIVALVKAKAIVEKEMSLDEFFFEHQITQIIIQPLVVLPYSFCRKDEN